MKFKRVVVVWLYTMVWKKYIKVIYRDFWFLYKSLKSPLYELHSVLYIIALYVSFLTIVSQVFVSVEPWAELVEERGKKKRWRFEVCGPFWSWWQLAKMDEVLPPFPVNRFHFSNRKISMVHDFCTSRTWGYYIHTR